MLAGSIQPKCFQVHSSVTWQGSILLGAVRCLDHIQSLGFLTVRDFLLLTQQHANGARGANGFWSSLAGIPSGIPEDQLSSQYSRRNCTLNDACLNLSLLFLYFTNRNNKSLIRKQASILLGVGPPPYINVMLGWGKSLGVFSWHTK